MQERDLKEKFIHRDVSWLNFNERVLEEAADAENPLLERLRFLAIFLSNLDEFFMVRVAGLRRLLDSRYDRKDVFGYYPPELFEEIKQRCDAVVKRVYELYRTKLKKELEKNNIHLKSSPELNADQQKFVKKFFETTIFPIITPMAIDQGHPFPILPSKTLAFAVSLTRNEKAHLAIIPIPKNLPRILRIPSEKDEVNYVLIDEIIRQYLANFFRGFKISDFSLFRVIRDSELTVDEEVSPDLLKAIETEIKKRPKAKVVWLEIEKTCSLDLLENLCQGLDFDRAQVASIDGDLDLTYLFELVAQVVQPNLSFRSYLPPKFECENIFEKIKEGDFLLHLPYQSFQPTVDLIQSAAKDESVLAIKMTLYRASEDSAIIKALKEAAKNKKQVTVLLEIKARFEEEKNINWARELEEAGCHVVYGIAGMKIHSKITLVVRKEEGKIVRYVHLSSGNYNEKTAHVYTDFGYFTANEDFARDISDVFNVITGYSLPARWKRIISSPYDLRQYFFELIDEEINFQKKYKNGLIMAKMNSLEDPKIIEKLYEASSAGVKIKLLVRGVCCLIPGVDGLSENIEVKSIVGRFLEHSRIFVFNNNSNSRIFISSADWMRRNFDRRIELLFEIYKDDLKAHLLKVMEMYGKDNAKSRWLQPNKEYIRPKPDGERFNAQEELIRHYVS